MTDSNAGTSVPVSVSESVAILVPARNEAINIADLLATVTTQQGLAQAHIIVLDDLSTDGTFDIAKGRLELATGPVPGEVIRGESEPPTGWLGKAWACEQLAHAAGNVDILVFIDADVRLAPDAVARAIQLMRTHKLDIVCPYPRQVALTGLQRLVQPLLQWSWATTLPLRLAEKSPRDSLSAGNGQFLVVDAAAYKRAGGHAVVRGDVLEDIAMVRAIKGVGGAGGIVDGTDLAECTMYANNSSLIDGYAKSLWSACGGPVRGLIVAAALSATYTIPVIALVIALTQHISDWGRPTQLWEVSAFVGYASSVFNRMAVARRTRSPLWDGLAHPLSILCFGWLMAASVWRRYAGTLQWRGRRVS